MSGWVASSQNRHVTRKEREDNNKGLENKTQAHKGKRQQSLIIKEPAKTALNQPQQEGENNAIQLAMWTKDNNANNKSKSNTSNNSLNIVTSNVNAAIAPLLVLSIIR